MIQEEIASAFSDLQGVFGLTATIQGVDGVPVTRGPNVTLSMGYGDGGTNQLQAVSLWYRKDTHLCWPLRFHDECRPRHQPEIGQAVITKLIQGSNITLTSTGAV
jgi:hypothetical protein